MSNLSLTHYLFMTFTLSYALLSCSTTHLTHTPSERAPSSASAMTLDSKQAFILSEEAERTPVLWMRIKFSYDKKPIIKYQFLNSPPLKTNRFPELLNPNHRFFTIKLPAIFQKEDGFLEVEDPRLNLYGSYLFKTPAEQRKFFSKKIDFLKHDFTLTLKIPLSHLGFKYDFSSSSHWDLVEKKILTFVIQEIFTHFEKLPGKAQSLKSKIKRKFHFNEADFHLKEQFERFEKNTLDREPAATSLPNVQVIPLQMANSKSQIRRTKNRLQIHFFAEGFTATQMTEFIKAAQEQVNYIFGSNTQPGIEPFATYQNYFIANAVFIPSNEPGTCHPELPENKDKPCPDTFFQSFFNHENIPRLMYFSKVGQENLDHVLRKFAPSSDINILLINDTSYTGAGGPLSFITLNSRSAEILAHELGHSFAGLGDEYSAPPYPGFPEIDFINISQTGDSTAVKWKSWIDTNLSHTLDSKECKDVPKDLQQAIASPRKGALYDIDLVEKRFRPACNCKMKELAYNFCPVCQEAILSSIYQKISPIDFALPQTETVNGKDKSWELSIEPMQPNHPLKIEWSVDGKVIQGAQGWRLNSSQIDLPSRFRNYHITARVWDPSPFLSQNMASSKLFSKTQSWRLKR